MTFDTTFGFSLNADDDEDVNDAVFLAILNH